MRFKPLAEIQPAHKRFLSRHADRLADLFAEVVERRRDRETRVRLDPDRLVFPTIAMLAALDGGYMAGGATLGAGVELADENEMRVIRRDSVEHLEAIGVLLPADARAV